MIIHENLSQLHVLWMELSFLLLASFVVLYNNFVKYYLEIFHAQCFPISFSINFLNKKYQSLYQKYIHINMQYACSYIYVGVIICVVFSQNHLLFRILEVWLFQMYAI